MASSIMQSGSKLYPPCANSYAWSIIVVYCTTLNHRVKVQLAVLQYRDLHHLFLCNKGQGMWHWSHTTMKKLSFDSVHHKDKNIKKTCLIFWWLDLSLACLFFHIFIPSCDTCYSTVNLLLCSAVVWSPFFFTTYFWSTSSPSDKE